MLTRVSEWRERENGEGGPVWKEDDDVGADGVGDALAVWGVIKPFEGGCESAAAAGADEETF